MAEEENKDPFDGEYIGNIWGWKISFIGLGVLLFFLGLMIWRSYSTGKPFFPTGEEQTEELVNPLPDTLDPEN
ncbi:MAG: hypothetical protein GYB31_18735 [Bacteroidetes bacterium]|nr:hypothetical protein [Bacteroidota bacterium]